MAGRIVSLSRARKDKARAEKRQKADANAVKFGRTRNEKARDAAEAERASDRLDQHRRDPE